MHLSIVHYLTIINSGIAIIIGAYMLYFRNTITKNGPGYWAASSFIIGIGLLMRFFVKDGYFTIMSTNLFLTAGDFLFLAGLWEFKRKPIHNWIIFGFPLLDIFQTLFFIYIFPSYRTLCAINSILIIISMVITIYELFNLDEEYKYLKKVFGIMSSIILVYISLIFLNFLNFVFNPNCKLFEVSAIPILLNIFGTFILIGMKYGLTIVINLQSKMELMEELKSKTKLFSIISHDLRGPVGNMMSFIDILQSEKDLSEKEKKEYFEFLNSLSKSTYHLLQNLLDWSTKSKNINHFESDVINLNTIIKGEVELYKQQLSLKSIHFEFIQKPNAFILGNENMMRTVMRNFISNAIKFTHKYGTISIAIEKFNDKIQIIISDTGIGIEEKTLKSITNFEFNISSVKGTNGEVGSGIGLAICKDFIDQNNGIMKIESKINAGTTITVEFPPAIR